MAISTYKTFLMHLNGSDYEKLVDVTEIPDLGGSPELLDTTTLSDGETTNILGIQSSDGLSFSANYDYDDYLALKALEGKEEGYAVWLGGDTNSDGTATPTGDCGKYSFKGYLSVYINGGGVNTVLGMTITIAKSTVAAFE